jgi:PiT family inorganic phosphate transporter
MLSALLLRLTLFPAGAKDANNNSKDVATLYGSNSLSYEEALKLAAVGQVARSAHLVLLSDNLLKTFVGKGLASADVSALSPFLTSVGISARATVMHASYASAALSDVVAVYAAARRRVRSSQLAHI